MLLFVVYRAIDDLLQMNTAGNNNTFISHASIDEIFAANRLKMKEYDIINV